MKMRSVIQEDFDVIGTHFDFALEKLRNASILVTGSTGMIASYLGGLLLHWAEQYNMEIYLQCRNLSKAEKKYASSSQKKNCHFIAAENIKDSLNGLKLDYIVHAASYASTPYFNQTPVEVMYPNIFGTWDLLEYAKEIGAKMLLCSSNSVYGEEGIAAQTITETDYGIVDPMTCRASYIESKRCAEQMCAAFTREYGVQTNIIRISHTYGPTFDIEKDGRIIPRSIKKILTGQDIELYDDPYSKVQYTYVGDIISAMLCLLARGVSGEAYNACGDEMLSLPQMIEYMLQEIPGSKSRLVLLPMDGDYAFKKGSGANIKQLDSGKLQTLGWRSLFNGKTGLQRTIQSYIQK